jgi:ATP-dependent DNA helicase RecG
MKENQFQEKKSIKIVSGKTADWAELAKDCVCFANARGGMIAIGIEDSQIFPPENQKIDTDLPFRIKKRISENTVNVGLNPTIETAENGGQFILLRILPSASTIASTSDGKYYYRSSDSCVPLLPDELSRLFTDKPSFIWETKATKIPKENIDLALFDDFMVTIKASRRVSAHIKEKSSDEILEHYHFIQDNFLTNLGVLWVGKRFDRSQLLYAPAVHFFKYDSKGQKINRLFWDDYSLNPKMLIEAIWTQIHDWKDGIEVSDGMFRRFIPNYEEEVIRELLANALVHRPYTMRGDIYINLYPEKLEVVNPGLFPIGITPDNILHKNARRNEKLAQVFFDLNLMDREGSGIDKIYEILLSNGKQIPKARQGDDFVEMTIVRHIAKQDILAFLKRADQEFQLTQKERICLGLISQKTSLTAFEFSDALKLPAEHSNAIRDWLGRLPDLGIIESQGRTRGTEYFVNPLFLKKTNFKGKTTLKIIAPHRLKELIYQDIAIFQPVSIGDIHYRIGIEISKNRIQKMIKKMCEDHTLLKTGTLRHTVYSIRQIL